MNIWSNNTRLAALTASIVAGLTAAGGAPAHADPVETWSDGYGHMWGGMMGGGLMMLLFWGVILAVIVLVVRALMRPAAGPHGTGQNAGQGAGQGDAEEILRARFARGEIDEDEYRRRRAVLDD